MRTWSTGTGEIAGDAFRDWGLDGAGATPGVAGLMRLALMRILFSLFKSGSDDVGDAEAIARGEHAGELLVR
jgi:hypothetical protein